MPRVQGHQRDLQSLQSSVNGKLLPRSLQKTARSTQSPSVSGGAPRAGAGPRSRGRGLAVSSPCCLPCPVSHRGTGLWQGLWATVLRPARRPASPASPQLALTTAEHVGWRRLPPPEENKKPREEEESPALPLCSLKSSRQGTQNMRSKPPSLPGVSHLAFWFPTTTRARALPAASSAPAERPLQPPSERAVSSPGGGTRTSPGVPMPQGRGV